MTLRPHASTGQNSGGRGNIITAACTKFTREWAMLPACGAARVAWEGRGCAWGDCDGAEL